MKDDLGRLGDILEAIDKIQQRSGGGRAAFEAEELLQVWAVHHLQIMGEAASRLSPELTAGHLEVPWSKIIGMRNILVHDYFGIDIEVVWNAVAGDLPLLKSNVENIIKELRATGQSSSPGGR